MFGILGLVIVLIESDWNLKDMTQLELDSEVYVLIESDWNLKYYPPYSLQPGMRINRIRLEFKVKEGNVCIIQKSSINRIRLEFKVRSAAFSIFPSASGINRIRLEFKDVTVYIRLL